MLVNSKMKHLYWLLLIITYFGDVLTTSPLRDPGTCGPPVCEGQKKFGYALETDYVYRYIANVTTYFHGTNFNATTLLSESDLSLKFISPCEATLQVEKTVLYESLTIDGKVEKSNTVSPRSSDFSNALSQFPLRFSFQDGFIEEICPLDEELSWVLNFKRGILSTLQNTMERFDVNHHAIESDVNGDCVTSYSLIQPRNTGLILRKIKRLSSCSNRYKQHSVMQSTPYSFQSKYKSVPLMMSASVCKIVVDHNVYSEIACEESHLFQPFASHKRGAKTTVKQRLILLAENNATIPLPDQINRRFTLRFDHHQTPKPTSSELKTSRELIKSLCRLNADDVEEGFSYAFKKFIQTTRVLTYEALTQLYTRAPSHCAAGRKHVKNALPLLGTNAAISLMKDIILRNELTDDEVKDWLFSIALIPSPDRNTLAAVNPLLKYEKHSTEAILAVSAVVHTYTKNHPEAEDRPEVLEIVYHLEKIAQSGCNTKKQAPDNIKLLTALKALGNIGVSTPLLNQTLQICVENDMLHLDERIAAIETHRRLPCDLGRNYLTQLFKDPSIDTELRIAAYLEVMRCPSYQLIRSIKEMLLTEEVNQVGSFIMSHLNSLQKSSMPSRVEIQGLLTDVDLKTKFSSDVRKFSQYFEKSMFHDGYNVGGNIEGSLVFSPKSYIPRSTTLNLTLDLFGESINMLEVTTRAEGFEYYIESLFGPSGRFNNKKVNEVLQSLRYKRQTTATAAADTLQNEVHEKGEKVYNSQMQPKISLGVKIFGNELKYFNFLGDEKIKKLFNSLNPVQQLKNLLAENEITFEKSTMFLDSSYAVPTSVGLPIKLNAIGTAAVNFKTTGSFKAADFLNTGDLNVEGHIRPSIAVDVTGSMVVDAYYTETNIKIKSNIYSSAAVQCQAKIRGMDLISASFSLPKEKTEIFSAQSELLVQNELQDGIREGRSQGNLCTWDPVEQMLGLRFCLDYQFPNASQTIRPPTFLFTGPVRFNAYVKKTDPSVQKYLMEFKWNKSENTSLMSFVFDTPGSRTPRQFTTQLEINSKNRTSIQLVLQSAKTKWEAQGQYLNTPDDRHVAFSLLMNGSKQLTAELGVLRVEAKNGYIYSPRLYLAYNKTEVAKLTGSVRKEEKKGIAQWHVNLKVNVINGNTNITGYVKRTDTSVSANVTTNYQIKASKPERVRLAFEVKRKTGKSMEQAQGEIKIECTAYPYFNINGSAKYVRKQLSTDLKIELNGSIEDENRWMVALAYTDQRSLEARKLLTSIEIAKPKDKIDFKFAFDYHQKGPETDASARLRYAQGKEIYTSLYLKTPHANLRVIEGKLNVTLPSSTPMIINGTLKETIFNEYDVELYVTWFSGLRFKMKGSFHDKSTIKQSHYTLKLILSSTSFNEISVTGKYSRDSTDFHIDLLVLQNNDTKEPYALTIKHVTPNDEMFETAFEIKYKNKVFSGTIEADLRHEKQIKIDLHIDKYRDISISFGGINLPARKRLEFDIKWDVNRDPGQKLSFSVNFNNPAYRNYSLNALLSYPGRTVKFDFEGAVKGLNYLAFVHFEWSPDSVIEITSNFVRVIHEDSQFVSLKTEFLSPFTNWKKTTFTMEWKMLTNMFQIESNVHWQKNQNINLNAFGRYEKTDDYFICQYNGTLLSSIDGISSISSNFMHKQTDSTFTTDLHLQKGPEQLVLMKSDWKIIRNEKSSNLTGRIDMISPFQDYSNGTLIGKVIIHDDAEIHGIADLKLENRNFRIDLDGHLTSLTENMLILNISTPIPDMFKFTARFGYSEKNRHFVAEIRGPKRAFGVEVLLNLKGIAEFDVILNLATPFEEFHKVSVVGNSRNDSINLKAGFNKYDVGLSGMWFYESLLNFEYNFQIYTPMPGYEVSGVVAKLRKNEAALDFEMSLQIADAKLGVKVQGSTKAPETLETKEKSEESEFEEEEEEEDDEKFYWSGQIQIDSILYPPIKGILHIEEIEEVYDATLSLTLPEGTVEIKDQLGVVDFLNMKNHIQIKTPWESFSEMKSHYFFSIDDDYFFVDFNAKYKNQENWTELGIITLYNQTISERDATEFRHIVFHLHSPLEMLKLVHLNMTYEKGLNMYRANFSGQAGNNAAELSFNLKAEEGVVDFSANVNITTIYIQLPVFQFKTLYDVSGEDRHISLLLDLHQPLSANCNLEVTWPRELRPHGSVKLRVVTPYSKFKTIVVNVQLEQLTQPLDHKYKIYLLFNEKEIQANGSLNLDSQKFEGFLTTTFEKYRNFKLIADYNKTEEGRTVYGVELHHDEKAYLFEGWSKNNEDDVLELHGKLISGPKNLQDLVLEYSFKLKNLTDGYYLSTQLQYTRDRVTLDAEYRKGDNYLEINADMKTTLPGQSSYIFNGKAQKLETGNMTAEISLKTPLRNFENINLQGSCLVTRSNGACRLSYEFNKMKGFFDMDYVWLFEENMAINVQVLMEKADEQKKKHYVASIFYRNENKSFNDLSFGLDYNKNDGEWQIGSNVTVLFTDFLEANIIIYLPDPYKETYKVLILRKNPFSVNDMILNVRFEALEADIHYGLQTQFQDNNKITFGVFGIDTNIKGTSRAYSNVIDVKKLRRSYDITYILKTPYYVTDTLTLKLNYTKRLPYIVRSSLYYPETTYAAGVNFDYESLSNMNGTINSTTPIQGLDYTGLTLQVLTQSDYYKRSAMLFWPNNTALIRSDATYDTSRPETQVNGTLVIEIPVTSRHIGIIDYKYFMENSETRIGHTVVQYNSRNVLEAKLRSHGLVTRGLEKENIYLEIENQMAPIGVRYNHVLQYNPDILSNRLPKRETHRAEVFKLRNAKSYNLTGELEVKTTETGKEIKITAHNPNRTVHLSTVYNILDKNLQHSSMLRVDPQSWLAYDLRVEDKTLDEETAEKHMEFNLRYPKRNVTLTGFYKLSAMKLTSEMIFYWDKNSAEKKVGAVVDWQKLSTKPTKQITSLSICHPSLEQDVKLSCELYADEKKMLDTKIDLVYSTDENKRLTIFGEMLNETNWRKKEYTLTLGAKHPATSLDVMVEGNVKGDGQLYQTFNSARYKRSYLPLQTGRAYAKLNIPEKSLEVESNTPKERQYWKGWYSVAPPLYTVSYDAIPSMNQNATGRFNLNVKEYYTALDLNSTEEGSSKNLHMRGNIPDARNAIFKIWRNYDGTVIPDVSFYLRLNHSRLITSKFIWRAELPEQLVAGYHKLSDDAWEGIYSTIDFWAQYIKSESMDAVYDIWGDAQPIVQGVLDDMSDIKDIENDMLLLCTYLNRSYHDNQFYIKDIVGLGVLLIDELSLRRHLENLPEVVNEIWSAMGESGESLRKSLIWFIETLKNTFEQLVEFLNKLMKGESTFEFSQLFDKLMESYDKFIKDLHLSFTVLIDEIMKYQSNSLREHWTMAQQIVAPTFLKLLHYAETVVWHAGEEVLDFFYEKQKEIQESPHYSKFAIFLRDLDAAWKDFTNNDAITNIQKYATMFFNFAREKYIAIVPFGRELEDMMNDLVKELGELQKLSSVSFILQKMNEVIEKIEWLYVRFDVTTKLKNIISFFHFKIHELTQTALTAENNNRKAKTKFIFEPERGIIEFEQKLPISWHSFNERPNFEEIPEYKAMVEVHNYFSPTNKSLWHYYNEYKPYADITNWLPPFKAQAIIAGNQHFVTFDYKLYGFRGVCSYLLATDFLDNNVTIILKYQPNTKFEYHKILIIVDHNIIKVDLFADMVQLNEKPQTILPFMIGNTTYVYQENKILKIENSYKGFSIECNMDFDICSVELSGWYFGKTAGLLGTMDNEQITDFMASNGSVVTDISTFAHSWAVDTPQCPNEDNFVVQSKQPDSKIVSKCETFFMSRDSEFQPCFSVVDPTPFMEMCLTSRIYKENEACTAAMAYLQTCQLKNTPVKLPPDCVRCQVQDEELVEGDYMEMHFNESTSSDVVFIVEAKECNRNLKNTRHIAQFLTILSNELEDANITKNRLAVVLFGGDGVFDEPRSVVTNNVFADLFTPLLFDNIAVGNGSNDIFGALRYAAKLQFRPGVSKTFILMPCSACNPSDMTLDYPAVQQMLLENDITLHILMNEEFSFNKTKAKKLLFGIDGRTAYTKKDLKELRGDVDLLRQVTTPKQELGLCIPLALETNGTLFTAKKMETDKPHGSKNFATVFAKRVALSALPIPCQICECMVDHNSVSSIFCSPCIYPTPAHTDAGFNDDSAIFNSQPIYDEFIAIKQKLKPAIGI